MFPVPPVDHSVPSGDLSVRRAHTAMQEHIRCPLEACPIKQWAKAFLVACGRLQPAERPKFGF